MNAIEIKGLEKRYPDFELKLDLDLPQGCILGLVGKNGAGKKHNHPLDPRHDQSGCGDDQCARSGQPERDRSA